MPGGKTTLGVPTGGLILGVNGGSGRLGGAVPDKTAGVVEMVICVTIPKE